MFQSCSTSLNCCSNEFSLDTLYDIAQFYLPPHAQQSHNISSMLPIFLSFEGYDTTTVFMQDQDTSGLIVVNANEVH